MPTFISLLRGINVSGQKAVKMDRLRRTFAALGFKGVKTYLQSGNVIFGTAKRSALQLSKTIERRISREFGFPVSVIVRTSEELSKILARNPFLKETGIDHSKLHVTFLSQEPLSATVKKLDAFDAAPDQYRCIDREIYLYCPNGYGRTKLSNNALEKALSVTATTRNWNTAKTLYEISVS